MAAHAQVPISSRELRRAAVSADAELARLAAALGDPIRVAILRGLARQKHCCSASLAGEFPVAVSVLNQHLRVLTDAGLIEREALGSRTQYCLNRENLAHMSVLLHDLVAVGSRPQR